jgi:hypothetical protein
MPTPASSLPLVLTQNPYLDLMRHALVNFIYQDDAHNVLPPYEVVPFRDYDRAYGKNFPSRCYSGWHAVCP